MRNGITSSNHVALSTLSLENLSSFCNVSHLQNSQACVSSVYDDVPLSLPCHSSILMDGKEQRNRVLKFSIIGNWKLDISYPICFFWLGIWNSIYSIIFRFHFYQERESVITLLSSLNQHNNIIYITKIVGNSRQHRTVHNKVGIR